MVDRKTINEYLFYEFGYDLQHSPSAIADSWPFELRMIGTIPLAGSETKVFEFIADDEVYFAVSASALNFYPSAGVNESLVSEIMKVERWR